MKAGLRILGTLLGLACVAIPCGAAAIPTPAIEAGACFYATGGYWVTLNVANVGAPISTSLGVPVTSLPTFGLAGQNSNGNYYNLQCDASGNLIPSGGPYLPLSGGTLTGELDGTFLNIEGSDGSAIRNTSGQIFLSDGYETLLMDSGSNTITLNDGAGNINLNSPGGNVELGYSGVSMSDNSTDSISVYSGGGGATIQGSPTNIADAYGDLIYLNNAVAISTTTSITLSENTEGTSISLSSTGLVLSSTNIQLSGLYNTGSGTVCADSSGNLSISPSGTPCP